MFNTIKMNDLFQDDGLINNFEFAGSLYQEGFKDDTITYSFEKNLVWEDMLFSL